MTRFFKVLPLGAALLALTISFLNCRNSDDPAPTAGSANIATYLVTEPSPEYKGLRLEVATVKVAAQGGQAAALRDQEWTVVGQPNRRVELMEAPAPAAPKPLTDARKLPLKGYNRVSLVLGKGPHHLRLDSGVEVELAVPEPLQKGIPLELETKPEAHPDYDIHLVLDLGRSIQKTTDGSGQTRYTLRPHLRAVDRGAAVAITGTLRDAAGHPQANHLLSAQSQGQPGIGATRIRNVRTDAAGSYRLDLLPWPGSYRVVSLAGGPAGLAAQASDAFRFERQADQVCPMSLQTQSPGPAGTLAGTIQTQLNASMHDEVEVLQELPPGSGQRQVVHGVLAVPAADSSSSSYTLSLPPGQYEVRHSRITLDAAGKASRRSDPLHPATVTSGGTVTVDF